MAFRMSACLTLICGMGIATAAEPPKPRSKMLIESPTRQIVAKTKQAAAAAPQLPRKKPLSDGGKKIIEAPVKRIVTGSAPAAAAVKPQPVNLDVSKIDIEAPTKALVKTAPAAGARSAKSDNPPVRPGKVRWHADYNAALAASKWSGRPVLLFQLLGQLDQKFT